MALSNWKDVKAEIERMKTNADVGETIAWIEKEIVKSDEFVRLNFTWMIESLFHVIENNSEKNDTLSLILSILLRIFNYSMNHPSPQRRLNLHHVRILVDKLDCQANQLDLNTQSNIIKCVKYAIK